MRNFQTFIGLCVLIFLSFAHADKKEGIVLTSVADTAMTIHSVATLPTLDNVDGIFSRPIDVKLSELLQNDHQWLKVSSQFSGGLLSPADLIKTPQQVIKISQSLKTDALLLAEVRKNPKDFVLALYLFSAIDGKLIAHVAATDLPQESTEKALQQLAVLYQQLKYRIPYDGLILSRTKNRVTLNLGSLDGLTPGQELACSKIIEVQRHPKLGHIIKHEKILIGKVKLIKVDPRLSFADITSESESGVIQKDTKITGARPVVYQAEKWIKNDYVPAELLLSENNNVKGRLEEWAPEAPPSFGLVGASFGLSRYQQSLTQTSTTLTSDNPIYPTITLFGEMWLNPEWFVHAQITQGTGTLSNPTGGSPSDLSASMGQYSLDVGYNVLLRDDFFDAKIFAALGYMSYEMSVDIGTPAGFVNTKYSGLRLLLGGKTPIDDARLWTLGGSLYWYIDPTYHESPSSSEGADSSIVQFLFSLDYRWSERVLLNGGLEFTTYMSDFTGPNIKGSQRFQTAFFGASYMF